ncbi:MAG: FAD-dependent thymidylate synthase [Bacillota bacterium]
MKVRVIDYTQEPDRTVAVAARLCYSPKDVDDIQTRMGDREVGRMIQMLRERGHLSPLEHAYFTVAIEGLSRVSSHQLVRSRIASYSQQSQRYIDQREFDFVIPPSISEDPELQERFRRHLADSRSLYGDLRAAGVPGEDARFVLPQAVSTSIIMSKNARAWLEWFELRMCSRAQWEIRRLAEALLKELRELAPHLFAVAGPPCQTQGLCREGADSCGRIDEMTRNPDSLRLAPVRVRGERD